MTVLSRLLAQGFEQLIAFQSTASGLRGFIAIHDTSRGPAIGGIRLWPYVGEEDALADALRLARAMSYKASLAGLPCGGGKATLVEHPGFDRKEGFADLGRLVENLGGRFYTGPDVGVTQADLEQVGTATRHVARGPGLGHGDVGEHTALGVHHAVRACLSFTGPAASGRKLRAAVQGVGSVGMRLARLLHDDGMELTVADTDASRARAAHDDLGARIVEPDAILDVDADVLAPCALGGVLSSESVGRLQARIVCGSANDQLADASVADRLVGRGVVYAPDYLVNAGGMIRGAEQHLLGRADSLASVARIGERTLGVLRTARERGVSPARVADELAEAGLGRDKPWSARFFGATGRS